MCQHLGSILRTKSKQNPENNLRPCLESPENTTTAPPAQSSCAQMWKTHQKSRKLCCYPEYPTVCWGQFAQGLSLSVMVSLYSLALEGFVLCALLSSHTQPRLPKHPSDIPVGSDQALTHESHSKSQLPMGPVQSSLVEANNLSDSTKGPTEQPQSHCHSSTLLRGHIIPSLG